MSLTKASYSMIAGAPVNILDFGADPTGVADSSTAIQNALNSIVATAKPNLLLIPSGTYKCNTGLAIDARYVSISANGASLNFSNLTTGTALNVTGNNVVNLGGIRAIGNSNAGSVNGLRMVGAPGAQVDSVKVSDFVIQTFGTGILLGDQAYILEFNNFVIADCLTNVNSNATTNAGSSIKFFGGNLINTLGATGTLFKNNNPSADFYFYGTVFDGNGKNFDISAGSIELYGCHIEPADFLVTPVILTGASTRFRMVGGLVGTGAVPTTAPAFVNCDSSAVQGAHFHNDVLLAIQTSTGYLFEGSGAANCISQGAISANRNSLLGNALADGSFENGAVLYGSANGTSNFADLVSILIDNGGVPANNLTTGTNLTLTFSTSYARTGTKSLRLLKSAALAQPATFGIFRELPKGNRPSARIWYKKPGSETGTLYISMGFYKLQLDSNGVPILQRQGITLASTVTFTSAAVDWTASSLFDLYAPPWASHFGISINATDMSPCSIYFDDAEISIL